MKYFISITKAHKASTFFAFAMNAVQSLFWVGTGLFISYITDQVINETASLQWVILSAVALCILIPVVEGAALQAADLWRVKLRGSIEFKLTGYASHSCNSPSEAQNALSQEIDALIASYFDRILLSFGLVVQFCLAVAAGFVNAWMITAAVLVFVLVSMWISGLPAKRLSKNFQAVQDENKKVLAATGAVVSAAFDLRVYGAQGFAHHLSFAAVKRRLTALRTNGQYKSHVSALNSMLSVIVQFGTIIAALAMVLLGLITFGNMMAVFLILQYIVGPLNNFIHVKNSIDSTRELREKFVGYENRFFPSRQDSPGIPSIDRIELNSVSYRYTEETDVIRDVSAVIEAGKRYLILGKSGSGKSTLLKLLLRDIDPTSGAIRVNGAEARGIDRFDLYRHIGYIGQRSHLLPISLGQNLSLRDSVDADLARRCLDTVNLRQFQPDYLIDDDFGNLSGGELQRVLLGRLLYQKRDFLVVDEFTSSLDPKNALELERLILNMEKKTILHVTHKVNAPLLEFYDVLMILRDGALAYCGAPIGMDKIETYYT